MDASRLQDDRFESLREMSVEDIEMGSIGRERLGEAIFMWRKEEFSNGIVVDGVQVRDDERGLHSFRLTQWFHDGIILPFSLANCCFKALFLAKIYYSILDIFCHICGLPFEERFIQERLSTSDRTFLLSPFQQASSTIFAEEPPKTEQRY